MILITSSSAAERSALAGLCSSRGWITAEYADIRGSLRAMERATPKVIVTRHKLPDGFSDDLIQRARQAGHAPGTRVVILAPATLQANAEARQILLGADCVLRDPIRTEVLCAYLERLQGLAAANVPAAQGAARRPLILARATLDPAERRLSFQGRSVRLTPREVSLGEALLRHRGMVVPYETLFLEVLERKYSGDTSNLRVLLGKLATSFAKLGLDLRRWVEVIPKAGHKLRLQPTGRVQPHRARRA
jgi:DNA-binding response OmpR family regulator